MSVLIMTGTIQPKQGARELARTDVGARIEDYRTALAHYLRQLRAGRLSALIFAENSGYGMDPFTSMVSESGASEKVELISYDALQPPGEPRFWGECKLLREAARRSSLLADSRDSHVWKVTGRYIVPNLTAILNGSEGQNDLILHCRNHPMRFVDFGLAGFARGKLERIIDLILSRQSETSIDERVLRDMIDDGDFRDLKLRLRLNRIPDFRGVRGIDNGSYGGLRYRAKFYVRSLVHRMLPAVWI